VGIPDPEEEPTSERETAEAEPPQGSFLNLRSYIRYVG